MSDRCSALILAAGKGTRMRSEIPKVLHQICGMSLIEHVLENLKGTNVDPIGIVTGYKRESVENTLGDKYEYFNQDQQLGTAHAVAQAKDFLRNHTGYVLVLCGDAPMQHDNVINAFLSFCLEQKLDLGVLTANLQEPASYGRIIRTNGKLSGIVEKKDCTPEQLAIKEVNSGTYLFDTKKLLACLDEIGNKNAQNEYYLTDAVELFLQKGWIADAFCTEDPHIISAVNTPWELHNCQKLMQNHINHKLIDSGVMIMDADTTYIDRTVTIGEDTVIYPMSIISGDTKIGKSNTIIASRIDSCSVGNDNTIDTSTLESSIIQDQCKIGPYAHIRPDSLIKNDVKIGNFVEIKKSVMEQGSKASHLTYVGDAEVGEDVNLGCGTIFVNYDGKNKFKTIVKKGAFIGCNSNLISPVTIGEGAYVGAGSTITEDVEANALAIARCRMTIKHDWVKKNM